jgi:tRNA1(Val) A37 N6-methylase TrmN6
MSDDLVLPDESLDDLRAGGLKIIQKRDGYRFSLDPVLLCDFARLDGALSVADLGSGAGVIPLLLARRNCAAQIVGVEIQPELVDRARRSLLLNGMQDRITIVERDLRDLRNCLSPQCYDAVLSNPPYRREGTGRTAPLAERAAARHELAGGLDDFLAAAAYLLKQGGRFYIIFLAERLAELLEAMRRRRLEPKRLRTVHSRNGDAARMVLVEGRRDGHPGMTVEAPFYVYDGENYTAEVLAIYGEGDDS